MLRARGESRVLASTRDHVRHHHRFYASASFGVFLWLASRSWAGPLRLLIAGDGFFALYLSWTALETLRVTADYLRDRASYADEGVHLIVLLTLAAISLSLGAIFYLLSTGRPPAIQLALAIASVPLGWLTLHTVAGFHYAHLFYTAGEPVDGARTDAGGLAFPATAEPTLWDFLYYSFVVGMTSQVSDVQVLSGPMRRLTLVHGVTSFFINTVLVALAVNAAATYGGR
jgi:uncharacterized membrane protein